MIRQNYSYRHAGSRLTRLPRLPRLPRLLCMLLLLPLSTVASGQESALDYIRPRLDREQYAALCTELDINAEQRQIVDLLFKDYLTSIEALSRGVDQQAKSAGRNRVADVFAGRARMGSDDLRRLRVNVLSTYRVCGPRADTNLEQFLTGLEGVLQDGQKSRWPAVQQSTRRAIFLQPLQSGSKTFSYAGEGVDVIQLAEEAMGPGGELTKLDQDLLAGVLNQYALDLDELLRSSAKAFRDHRLEERIARLENNQAAIKQHNRAILDAWGAQYTLNRDTVNRISELVGESADEWAQRLWLERFNRASFTWLYQPRTPDRQLEWMRSNEVASSTIQDAELKYGLYMANRDALQKEAIMLMVKARLERGIILHQLSNAREVDQDAGDLYQELLRNSGAMTNLDTKYAGEFESMLEETQRKAMRRYAELRRRY